MAFSSQFSLSLELTRLLPLLPRPQFVEDAVRMARDFQGSGSDIVVEEDLIGLYGRTRIEPQLASSFRTAVSKTASKKLCEGINLESGPGPTVSRALSKNQTPYFAMVVQCSLLSSIIGIDELAVAIQHIFEKQAEDAPPEAYSPVPSVSALEGALQACQEQTTTFDWKLIRLAVEQTLDLDRSEAYVTYTPVSVKAGPTLPEWVLRGLTVMLPSVQSLPDDRFIHIEMETEHVEAIVLIIVWAHTLLDLTVAVHFHSDENPYPRTIKFGMGEVQVILELNGNTISPGIILMSTAEKGNDELFRLDPDPDSARIIILPRESVKNYGRWMVSAAANNMFHDVDAVVEEMAHVVCAFASLVSRKCEAISPWDAFNMHVNFYDMQELDESMPKHRFSLEKITQSTQALFHDVKVTRKTVQQYVNMYQDLPLDKNIAIPNRILAVFKRSMGFSNIELDEVIKGQLDEDWALLVEIGRHLAVVALALAQVEMPTAYYDFPLVCLTQALQYHPLAAHLRAWDGREPFNIGEYTLYHAIGLLLLGHNLPTISNGRPPALVSGHGWSVYVGTFFQPQANSRTSQDIVDPSLIKAGKLGVSPGVPWRNRNYRHAIFDSLVKDISSDGWTHNEQPGDTASLRCPDRIYQGRPLYGEREDYFMLTLRLITEADWLKVTRRTGCAELFSALWLAQKSNACTHDISKIILDPGCITVSNPSDFQEFGDRIVICLSARNPAARWSVLLAMSRRQGESRLERRIMLRGNDCCFQCVIEQVYAEGGNWFVVL